MMKSPPSGPARAARPRAASALVELDPPPARAADRLVTDQALVVSTTAVSHGLLRQLGVMSAACASWGGSVVATRLGAAAGEAWVAGVFGVTSALFSLYDSWLTQRSHHDAEQQHRRFCALLGRQHLLLHRLQQRVDGGDTEPALAAALGVGRFNQQVLLRLLAGLEEALLPEREREAAARLRGLRLDHLVLAERALCLRAAWLERPGEAPRERAARDAAAERDALAEQIAALDATQRVPLPQRLRGLKHGPFEHLSDEQLVLLRDGRLQPAKTPAELAGIACSLAAKAVQATAAAPLAGDLASAAGGITCVLAPLSALSAWLDVQGGARLNRRARRLALAEHDAVARLVALRQWHRADPDPLRRAMLRQTLDNLAHARARRWRTQRRLGAVGRLRRLKGLVGALNLPLVVVGSALALAGVASLATLPGALIGGVMAAGFMFALGAFAWHLHREKWRARAQQRAALRFVQAHGPQAIERLYLGEFDADPALDGAAREALCHNPYLSLEWHLHQLHAVALAPKGTAPCASEHLLRGLDLPPDTLEALRDAAQVLPADGHRRLLRAVLADRFGLRLFDEAPTEGADPAPPWPHPPVVPLDAPPGAPRAVSAPASPLMAALKALDANDRRHSAWGALRHAGRHRLATPGRVLRRLRALEARGGASAQEAHDTLLRALLLQWIAQLPAGEAAPAGDSVERLSRRLTALARACDGAADELLASPQLRASGRAIARRQRQLAQLARTLEPVVRRERGADDPWWEPLLPSAPDDEPGTSVEPPPFDDAAESASGAPFPCEPPLPAYALKA